MPLASLSPFGPIFAKELRVTARRKRTYLLRVVYLAILLIVLLLTYVGNRNMGGDNVAARTQMLNAMGRTFFIAFSIFSILAMIALGPVLTCSSVSSERLGKTLPVLLMTPITSWQIISGKLFSRVLVALTLLGLSLPALAVVRLLGGVEIEEMFAVICTCVATVLAGAALGLFFSTVLNRAYAVILLSYAVILFVYLFLAIVATMMMASGARRSMGMPPGMSGYMLFMDLTNPFFNIMVIVMGASGGGFPARPEPWWYGVISHLVVASLLVMFSGLILRRKARREASGAVSAMPMMMAPPVPMMWPPPDAGGWAPPTEPVGWAPPTNPQAVGDAPHTGAVPPPLPPAGVLPYQRPGVASPRRQKVRDVSDNPVLWREVRRPLLSRMWQRLLGLALFFGMLMVTYALLAANNVLSDRESQMGYICVFHSLLTLGICVLSATSIAQEKESDTWTLLLAAPLSSFSIVMGKTLGLLRRLIWPMAMITFHFLIFTVGGVLSIVTFLVLIWVMVTFNSLFLATGVWLSLRLKKATTAVILNLLIPIFLFAIMPILMLIAGALLTDRDTWAEGSGVYLPYNYELTAIQELSYRNHNEMYLQRPGDWHNFRLMGVGHVDMGEFLVITLVAGGVHVLLAVGILGLTILRFDRMVGRAHQSSPVFPPAGYPPYAPGPLLR